MPAPVFRRHGIYIEDTPATIAQYHSIDNAVAAVVNAGMTHAWLRIHGEAPYGPATKATIANFIAALKKANVAVAGWGWCQGDDPDQDAAVALGEIAHFALDAYLADIEPADDTNWTVESIAGFCDKIRKSFAGSFAVTTFPLIDWHHPELLRAALPYIDMINPQIYWFGFPSPTMVKQFKKPDGTAYRLDNAADYTDLCLDRWRRLMKDTQKPVVVSAQAYWGEDGATQPGIEAKVAEFISQWNNYNSIVGLNWYSLGGKTAMSPAMLAAITKAKLGDKPYHA